VGIFSDWCAIERDENGLKRLWKLTELPGGRVAVEDQLSNIIRSHYEDTTRILEDIQILGYTGAAAILAEKLPRSVRARSGELGEILATELVEEETEFEIPVRRLRYKDGREMALRGDDLLGVNVDEAGNLCLLKGESKSRVNLAKSVIDEARGALSRDDGRPTATSLLFIAGRLMDQPEPHANLGRIIRNEVSRRAVPASRIDHVLFTLSGNNPEVALSTDLLNTSEDRKHTVINVRIEDHQGFILTCYEKALALGND
jgi:hypothetical protein